MGKEVGETPLTSVSKIMKKLASRYWWQQPFVKTLEIIASSLNLWPIAPLLAGQRWTCSSCVPGRYSG